MASDRPLTQDREAGRHPMRPSEVVQPSWRGLRTAGPACALAVFLTGCASVPDAVNPVEWYKGAADWTGEAYDGIFGSDGAEPSVEAEAPTPSEGDGSEASAEAETEKEGDGAAATTVASSEETETQEPGIAEAPEEVPGQAEEPSVALPQDDNGLRPDRENVLYEDEAEEQAGSRAGDATPASSALSPDPGSPDPGDGTQDTALAPVPDRSVVADADEAENNAAPGAGEEEAGTPFESGEDPERVIGGGALPEAGRDSSPPEQVTADEAAAAAFAQSGPAGTGAEAGESLAALPLASLATPPEKPSRTIQVGVIGFDRGSSQLSAEDRRLIREIAQLHEDYGGYVRVVGHASSRTRDLPPLDHKLVNFEVSVQRAEAVASHLIAVGVPKNRILVTAASDSEPIYYEFMPSGEAGNRRTEIFLDY